ncbi:MAG: hypothetical protein ABIH11_07800 [Candidatus Altiarchaeota archaeon]
MAIEKRELQGRRNTVRFTGVPANVAGEDTTMTVIMEDTPVRELDAAALELREDFESSCRLAKDEGGFRRITVDVGFDDRSIRGFRSSPTEDMSQATLAGGKIAIGLTVDERGTGWTVRDAPDMDRILRQNLRDIGIVVRGR